MRRAALAVISKTKPDSDEQVCARFIASNYLTKVEEFELMIRIQRETLEYVQTHTLNPTVLKDSLLMCFPVQIIKITLASSLCRNMQLTQALDILK